MNSIAVLDPRIDVRDLRLVLALEGAGSTAAAAPILHLTQPAVSRALLALEEKLGTKLFERSAQGLVPNERGQRLLGAARRLLTELTDVERHVRAVAPAVQRLRIVCQCYTAYHWLPSVARDLRVRFPGITLSLEPEHSADPVAALVSCAVDVALITTAQPSHPQIAVRPLFSDEIVFVLARDHPLAERPSLRLEDLTSTVLISSSITPPAEVQWFKQRVLGRQKHALKVQRLPLTEAMLEVARAGMGIAVISEWVARPHLERGDLVVRRLARGPLLRPWQLAFRKEVAAHAPALRAALRATVPRTELGSAR